jgi:hypothetical protein
MIASAPQERLRGEPDKKTACCGDTEEKIGQWQTS